MNENDLFTKSFKYYKSKRPPPELSNVVNFDLSNDKLSKFNRLESNGNIKHDHFEKMGIDFQRLQPYTLKNHNGLIFMRNPFTENGQKYWIRRCLQDYPNKPNKTNLDNAIYIENWWDYCHRQKEVNSKYVKMLRWSTLGFHHNWDTKIYSSESQSEFPEDLKQLCFCLAEFIGYYNYIPQASIVNYYHMDSTLSAHTDHSEINLEAPLISISFGQSAIFLLGGESKAVEPTALLIQSGDILIMAKESRLCYHAVPKILPTVQRPWSEGDNCDDFKLFDEYVSHSRINLNVRQVFNYVDTLR